MKRIDMSDETHAQLLDACASIIVDCRDGFEVPF